MDNMEIAGERATPEYVQFQKDKEALWSEYLATIKPHRDAYNEAIRPLVKAYNDVWTPAWELHEHKLKELRLNYEQQKKKRKELEGA